MLLIGDCLEQMKSLEDSSIDSVVTDPPYGLKFMGKKWDHSVPSIEIWREVLRVLKPGGHVLSFGGTRTYHRMAVAIEDAGFEIRDQLQWLYGSGFPKSHNLPGGIGTALKPANEPIVLARKPLIGTVAKSVEMFGTGGLNIDASRIETKDPVWKVQASDKQSDSLMVFKDNPGMGSNSMFKNKGGRTGDTRGRWPANIILDETAAEMLGEPSRFFYVSKASKRERNAGLEEVVKQKQGARPNSKDTTGKFADHDHRPCGGNNHPTVKPIKLMEYLIKLITPSGGTVLDPFMGSGTTGIACKNLGFEFIGIEMSEEYFSIAKMRIEAA